MNLIIKKIVLLFLTVQSSFATSLYLKGELDKTSQNQVNRIFKDQLEAFKADVKQDNTIKLDIISPRNYHITLESIESPIPSRRMREFRPEDKSVRQKLEQEVDEIAQLSVGLKFDITNAEVYNSRKHYLVLEVTPHVNENFPTKIKTVLSHNGSHITIAKAKRDDLLAKEYLECLKNRINQNLTSKALDCENYHPITLDRMVVAGQSGDTLYTSTLEKVQYKKSKAYKQLKTPVFEARCINKKFKNFESVDDKLNS